MEQMNDAQKGDTVHRLFWFIQRSSRLFSGLLFNSIVSYVFYILTYDECILSDLIQQWSVCAPMCKHVKAENRDSIDKKQHSVHAIDNQMGNNAHGTAATNELDIQL